MLSKRIERDEKCCSYVIGWDIASERVQCIFESAIATRRKRPAGCGTLIYDMFAVSPMTAEADKRQLRASVKLTRNLDMGCERTCMRKINY